MPKQLVLKLLRLNKDAMLPVYVREGDTAFDIYSSESAVLKKGEYKAIATGIASEIPQGYYVSFRGRSGLAFNNGIDVLAGVIDSNYRGEWKVIIVNLGKEKITLEKGERIAQGILQEVPNVKLLEVKKLSNSVRGTKGFGSSGKKKIKK
jgi:dUTP pyrophosphatase